MITKKAAYFYSIFVLAILLHPQSKSPYTDQDCLICHGEANIHQILSDGKTRSLYVDPAEWEQDVHHIGRMTCVDCHINASPTVHFREGQIDVDCARCHQQEEEEYQKNIHFDYRPVLPGRELPQCYHCHTRHHVLRHDDPSASIHEKNIGRTCGDCHAEVMVKGILKGTSLGKISGHRKGDISEKFDMMVCTRCHFQDSAHGDKRIVEDFCSRCHDVNAETSSIMGPTHLNSKKWSAYNFMAGGIVLLIFLGAGVFWGYRNRKNVVDKILSWQKNMRILGEEKEASKTEAEPTGSRHEKNEE